MGRKITINLTGSAAKALDELLEEGDETMTGALNRAIRLYSHLQRVSRQGGAIHIQEDPQAQVQRLMLF